MSIKYFLPLILVVLLTGICAAQINTSEYKILKIDDPTNFKYINDYPYVVFLNGSYYGNFTKDQEIYIPDGAEVIIYIPSPIKSNFAASYDLGKSILGMGFFLFLGFGLCALVAYIIIRKIWSKK